MPNFQESKVFIEEVRGKISGTAITADSREFADPALKKEHEHVGRVLGGAKTASEADAIINRLPEVERNTLRKEIRDLAAAVKNSQNDPKIMVKHSRLTGDGGQVPTTDPNKPQPQPGNDPRNTQQKQPVAPGTKVDAHGYGAVRNFPLQSVDNATLAKQNPNGLGPQGDQVVGKVSLILTAGKNTLSSSNPDPTSYKVNANGTFTDNTTGLTFTQPKKMTLAQAQEFLRNNPQYELPSMKQLTTLSNSTVGVAGFDTNSPGSKFTSAPIKVEGGNQGMQAGEGKRVIDGQVISRDIAEASIMGQTPGTSRMGYNFLDGRVKAYPIKDPRTGKDNEYSFMFVAKDAAFDRSEKNAIVNNGDGTLTDKKSGAVYAQKDAAGILQDVAKDPKLAASWKEYYLKEMKKYETKDVTYKQVTMSGEFDTAEAKVFAEWANKEKLYGRNDWRVPTMKEVYNITERNNPTGTNAGFNKEFKLTPVLNCYTNQMEAGKYQFSDRLTDVVPQKDARGNPVIGKDGKIVTENQVSGGYVSGGSAGGIMPDMSRQQTPPPKPTPGR